MFLENKMPLQDILVTMNIPICNIVNYISDDEMIAWYKQSEKQNNNEKRGEVFWRMLPLSYRIIPFGET